MNVVLLGGGELGRHVASILSKEKHSVILIDKRSQVLQEIAGTLDVATRLGSGTDWQLLDDLLEFSPDLFIALTGHDETNLVACNLAKQLHYPRTIARVRNARFTNSARLDFGRIFDVDYFLDPEQLAAQEILKLILSPNSIAVENFAHGALQLRTILIPHDWRGQPELLKTLKLPPNIIVGLIRRTKGEKGDVKQVIFPHGNDMILPGDEVTFIGEAEAIANIHELFAIEQTTIQSIVIAGGSLTGLHLAELASERGIDVRVIDKSYEKCVLLAEELPHSTVIQHDATDLEFFRSENIGQTDTFIACTNDDSVNLLASLLAQQVGCKEVFAMLKNTSYNSITTGLGLKHAVSPRTVATNHILSQLFAGKVTSLFSLYENEAEVIEVIVSLHSQVIGIPLSELGPFLPKDLLIVMIQNRGRIMIANGNRIISPGDTVIIVTSPKHVDEIAKIF